MKKTIQTSFFYKILFLIIVGCIAAACSFAQHRIAGNAIRLKGITLSPEANRVQWLDSMAQVQAKEPVQVLLQFETLPTQAQREALRNNGVTLLDYIPDNTFTALIQFPVNADNISPLSIHSIINVKGDWKASSYLWQKVNDNINGAVEVLVSFYPDIDSSLIRQFIKQAGGTIHAGLLEKYGDYKVIIAANKIYTLAEWYGTRYINPVSKNELLDQQSRPAVRGNLAVLPAIYGGYGLNGDSVTVGVGDNASGMYHIDLQERTINFNPAVIGNHGEHVNGIVGGAGIIDPLAEGMAPHITLVDHLYDNVLFYAGLMFQDYNMTITNNSYAVIEGDCSYSGTYDVYANFLDQLAVDYNDVNHVFAAGNDGLLNCAPYISGFGTVAGGYQPAKNNIVVGSMTDYLIEADDESRGPTKDGRMKPEITAVGLGAYSTIGVNQYEWAAGTSMASPQVAGALALLTQRYKQLYGIANPRADILKAILLNGATDLGNPGPDYSYGFGGMDVYRSLQILDSNRFVTNSISNGGQQSFNINVPANTAQVKVMLCWQDVPANPATASTLVNDLDLTVQDAALNVHLPLVPDSIPANVNNNATEQADHLNNVEQVTINNPAAGNYTINVKGYNVPSASQRYVVAYDFLPVGVQLTYPTASEKIINSDTLRVFWDAVTDSNTFTVQLSTDNGATWGILANNISHDVHHYDWVPGNINSGNCQVRVMRNNTSQQATSGAFVINTQPVAYLDSVQCPGYIKINWHPVTNATAYQVLWKKGLYMQVADTVTDTTYVFSGLSLNSTYYVAVSPIINGMAGYRSVAVTRRPNTGTCAEAYSNGDLTIQKIVAPGNGRQFTSIELNNNEFLTLLLRDLYSSPCNTYTASYSINGSSWTTLLSSDPIFPDSTLTVSIPGMDLSDTGTYHIVAAVHNLDLTDPVPQNDTINTTIINQPNNPIDLINPFFDGFETMGKFSVTHDSIGVSPNGHWDYSNNSDSGCMRSYVDDSITISGNRSISLDANKNAHNVQNYFAGTFNLSNYDTTSSEVRFQFDYELHGIPRSQSGNQVWVRGADTKPWVNVYNYDLSSFPGNIDHSGTLSFTDALRSNGQNFTTSSQVLFGQHDTSLIAARDYGNGVTLDNFTIYMVQNDVGLLSIVSPITVSCGAGAVTPVTVLVYNGVKGIQHNIHLFYQLDNGTVVADSLASIAGKDTVAFTFAQTINTVALGGHVLNVWLANTGDTYHANDSILNYNFRNQPLINSFPYLQNFEANDGDWYTEGINDSWQYGTPASANIHKAASGTKAWKTNLTGNYNNNELSYLYSPCFDISTLASPMLSFSLAMKIENCGSTLCDAAYMEYSYDGAVWTKLGAAGQGTNWYDSTTYQIWNEEGTARWHVASIPLPASTQPIRLRFVMASDPGTTFDGIAVDDIHIFDRVYPIYTGDSTAASQSVNGNQWANFTQSNLLLAQIQPGNQNINATVSEYPHTDLANPGKTQYFFPKSFTVKTQQTLTDSASVRLYITDSDILTMINDSSCPSCTKPTDAYALGVTKYDNVNSSLENSLLTDNVGGTYTYYPYGNVTWVPYDKGYYAEVKVNSFSEFWFNDGGITNTFGVGQDYVVFTAQQQSLKTVLTNWVSYIDTLVGDYEVQRSYDTINFVTIDSVASLHQSTPQYSYVDTPAVPYGTYIYYRLKWDMLNGTVSYSTIHVVDWTTSGTLVSVYPNPNYDGNLNISWNASPGTVMQVALVDESGREMYKTNVTAVLFDNLTTLAIPHYANGIYYIKIIIGNKQYIEAVMFNRH